MLSRTVRGRCFQDHVQLAGSLICDTTIMNPKPQTSALFTTSFNRLMAQKSTQTSNSSDIPVVRTLLRLALLAQQVSLWVVVRRPNP